MHIIIYEMIIFSTLLIRILPLYLLIALGFIAGKKLNAKKETIASVLIYIVTPVVIFNSILNTKIKIELLLLPVIFFICSSVLCMIFYFIGGKLFKDNTKNILAMSAGTANTGYFGIPVAIELFGKESLGIIVLCIVGFTVFENSLGFFITAKGNHTTKEAIERVFKLPTIYAFLAGFLLNLLRINFGENYLTFTNHFLGAYTILGMMLIGLGLSDIKGFKFDVKFILASFFARFIIWPLVILSFVFIDNNFMHLFNEAVHKAMLLMSIVPLAANLVAFATELKAQPEKAALAVFLSTIFALFYIPFMVSVLF